MKQKFQKDTVVQPASNQERDLLKWVVDRNKTVKRKNDYEMMSQIT